MAAIEAVRARVQGKVFAAQPGAAQVDVAEPRLVDVNFADPAAIESAVVAVGSSRAWRWVCSLRRRARRLRRKLRNERRAAYTCAARALAADPCFDVLLLPVLHDVSSGPRAARKHQAYMACAELDKRIDEAIRQVHKARLKVSEYGTTITSLYPVGMLNGRPVHEIARPGAAKVRVCNGRRFHRDIPSMVRTTCARTAEDFEAFSEATE